jgi:hypothetical protein
VGLFSRRKSSSSDLPESNDIDFYCGTGDVRRREDEFWANRRPEDRFWEKTDMFWEKKVRLLLDEGLISKEEFEEALRTKTLQQKPNRN